MKEKKPSLVKVTDERKYNAQQKKMRVVNDDPMMGEKFHEMYKRLEKETGGKPFMPSYAFDYVDANIKAMKKLHKDWYEDFNEEQKKALDTELAAEIKYRDLALENQP